MSRTSLHRMLRRSLTLARDVWFFDGRRIADHEVVEAFRPNWCLGASVPWW